MPSTSQCTRLRLTSDPKFVKFADLHLLRSIRGAIATGGTLPSTKVLNVGWLESDLVDKNGPTKHGDFLCPAKCNRLNLFDWSGKADKILKYHFLGEWFFLLA